MKKLAIVITHPIQYYAPLFRLLQSRGIIQIRIFYTWSKKENDQYEPDFGKRIQWDIPMLEGYDFEFVVNTSSQPGSHHFNGIANPELITQIEKWRPDAVLVFGWAYKSHLKVLRHFKKRIPVYFRGDSTQLDIRAGWREVLKKILLRWVYHHIDKAFYVGEENRKYFSDYGLKPNQLVFAPHAVDNDRFMENDKILKEQASEWRSSLNVASDKIVILFTGKLINKKDPLLLVNAYLNLPLEIRSSLVLLIVGDGVLKSKLEERSHGQRDILFLPFQNQSKMPVIYRMANVICVPSKGPGETWALTVNEAMAVGLPAIVSNKAGCASDLITSGTGWKFTAGSEEELSAILVKMINEKNTLEKMGEQAREHLSFYSFTHICEAIEKTILEGQ